MTNILISLVFFLGALGTAALAQNALDLPQSPGISGGYLPSPYPPVLSPALDSLPKGCTTIIIGTETYYYAKGIFYQKIVIDDKYTAVSPPIGAVVFDIPQGYQYMLIDGIAYYVYSGVFYIQVLEGYKVVSPVIL